jgi:hypothetical protein
VRLGPLFVTVIDASGQWSTTRSAPGWPRPAGHGGGERGELRIVMGHLPLVGIAIGRDRQGEVVWEAASLRDLMLAGTVDLYVSGHQAAYYPGRWEGSGAAVRRRHRRPPLRVGEAPAAFGRDARRRVARPAHGALHHHRPGGFAPYDAAALPPRIDGYGGTVERSQRDGSCAAPRR